MQDENVNFGELSLDELKKLEQHYINESNKFHNQEQAIKRILNSIYGAFGNEWFYFFNIDIAEAITLQGQHAILYAEKMLNLYFTDFWHKDTALHKQLGIEVTGASFKPVVIYIDTDSCYVSFQEQLEKCNWEGTEKDFILQLYKMRMDKYLEKVFSKYADSYGTENFLSFEMESVAKNAIWLAKKKYIQNIAWTDPDIHYEDLTKIKTKGYVTIQSSTPSFARKKLNEILRMIFETDDVNIAPIVQFLKEAKNEFKLADIEDICFNYKMNNYEKYILDDQKRFEFASGCQPNCRSAGYHNYLLNNSDHKNKYQLIKNGEKIKMYYTDEHEQSDVFGFVSGDYPYEFAAPVGFDMQFEKTVLDPLNHVLKAIGLQTLDRNLIYASSLW